MKYNIIIADQKLNKYHLESIKEFEKRLSRYCKTELVVLKKKGRLDDYVNSSHYKIQIKTGESDVSSVHLAEKLSELFLTGVFCVSIFVNISIDQPDWVLSISPMELGSGLTAAIIYEQLYRGYRILNNQPYHK